MTAASLHLPEVAPVEGLEVPYDGVEVDPEAPERVADSASLDQKEARPVRKVVQEPKKWWSARYLLIIVISLVLALIIAITLDVVFGVKRSR